MEPEKSGGDVTLSSYSGSNKTLTSFISGTTINFGAPGLRYMYANGKQTGSSQYFAYLNSNCMSVNSCTLAYKKNSLTTGMDGTTLT